MIVTVDTNVLVYSADSRTPERQRSAAAIMAALRASGGGLAVQVCGEFYRAATRRLGQAPRTAAQNARKFLTSFPLFASTSRSMETALIEAAEGRLSLWDANLLSSAEIAGCSHFLSEDMREGLRLGGVEVVRPFDGNEPSRRARELLAL